MTLRTLMLIASVPLERGEALRQHLDTAGLLDVRHRIRRAEGRLLIPVIGEPVIDLALYAAEWIDADAPAVPAAPPPFDRIRERVDLPAELQGLLPRKWELLGNVLLMTLPPELHSHRTAIGEAYAEVLAVKTVAVYSTIHGDWRHPTVERLWGDGTETTHLENGLRYRMDVAQVMFSSGNLPERIRMGRACSPGETVVDLCAGIGYFALAIAVKGGARVHACEVNPVAFHYLVENARINRATTLLPIAGDCREVAPRGVADRVVLGYLDGEIFLPTAMHAFRDGGTLHYHEACPEPLAETRPLERVRMAAKDAGLAVTSHTLRYLKSYSPGVWHVVLDVDLARP